jgi:hypothetical protein
MTKFKDFETIAKQRGIGGGGDWMNLQAGDNKIRIVSEIEDYGDHYDPLNKKRVPCLGEDQCEFCKKKKDLVDTGADAKSKEVQGLRPRVQFLFWVIDRSDKRIKLLRTGYQVYEAIGKLAKSDEYGFDILPDYDITIQRTGEGLDTKYGVIPSRKSTPLTDAEQKAIEEEVKPPSEIIEKMKAKVVVTSQPESNEEDAEPGFGLGEEDLK